MSRSSSTQKNRKKTTANHDTGGGFSLLIFSPMVLFFGMLWLLLRIGQPIEQVSTYKPAPIASFFTPEVQRWHAEISEWAIQFGLNPNLIATVMQIESCGNPNALSPAGAMGLFQVMPYHFESGESGFYPAINATRGLNYLKTNLERFGSIRLALAAYNGGPGNAVNPAYQWPTETRNYVYWGENIYDQAINSGNVSVTLIEWLNAGGASLCEQAKNN